MLSSLIAGYAARDRQLNGEGSCGLKCLRHTGMSVPVAVNPMKPFYLLTMYWEADRSIEGKLLPQRMGLLSMLGFVGMNFRKMIFGACA
jgi:hypothetical protein